MAGDEVPIEDAPPPEEPRHRRIARRVLRWLAIAFIGLLLALTVHEAAHAQLRSYGIEYSAGSPAREERVCRRAELRFGRALQADAHRTA